MREMNDVERFTYRPDSLFYPIPPSEQQLQTVIAKPWHHVEQKEPNDLEGVSFDSQGNLWYVESVASRIHKIDMNTKKDTVVYEDPCEEVCLPASTIKTEEYLYQVWDQIFATSTYVCSGGCVGTGLSEGGILLSDDTDILYLYQNT